MKARNLEVHVLERVEESRNKLLEEQRLREPEHYMIGNAKKKLVFCSGVENYSRHLALSGRGETPNLFNRFLFPKDFY